MGIHRAPPHCLPHKASEADQLGAGLLNVRMNSHLEFFARAEVGVRNHNRRDAGSLGSLETLKRGRVGRRSGASLNALLFFHTNVARGSKIETYLDAVHI